jgi:hypothetical protein
MLSTGTRIVLILILLAALFTHLASNTVLTSTTTFPLLSVSSSETLQTPSLPLHSIIACLVPDTHGQMTAVDTIQDQIATFDEQGYPLHSFGKFGQAPGEFDSPWTFDPLPNRRFAVLDKENARIEVFSSIGKVEHVTPIGAKGLKGLAIFPDGTAYVGRSGPAYDSAPFYSVEVLHPDGTRRDHWPISSPVLDVRRERNGRVFVLTDTGLLLYNRNGKLVKRLAIPKADIDPKTGGSSFMAWGMGFAPDGRVVVGTMKGDALIYDRDYRPLGMVPSKSLTGKRLMSVAIDDRNRLWATDNAGALVRVTLPLPAKGS